MSRVSDFSRARARFRIRPEIICKNIRETEQKMRERYAVVVARHPHMSAMGPCGVEQVRELGPDMTGANSQRRDPTRRRRETRLGRL